MEKLAAKRKNRKRRDGSKEEDRISKLPEPILHHILCFLDQRTAATTSVLSKSWRYLWCTRPMIDFRHGVTVVAGENKESFLSVLDRTLRGYHDRKLHLQELTLQLSSSDGETDSFLKKWIRILVQSMGVNQFHLYFRAINYILNRRMHLSLSIFRSESIQNLSLEGCVLKSIPAAPPLHLKHLRKLSLDNVDIPEEILDDILSNCRLVEYLSIARCTGFKRIELKHTSAHLRNLSLVRCVLESISAEPPLHLKHLRKLALDNVNISEEILDHILSNCRFIEYASLYECTGFKSIQLKHTASLREFRFKDNCYYNMKRDVRIAMGDQDIPTLRTLDIEGCLSSFNRNRQFYFPHLTHLTMRDVNLLSIDLFSCSLPCLEELILDYCSGIKELNLSSPSMKRMEIHNRYSPFRVIVNAPSIVSFRYKGVLPQSLSFSAAPTSWKSYIDLTCFLTESKLRLQDLIGLLKALSQSEIFVEVLERTVRQLRNQLLDTSVGVSYDDLPLVVDHLIAKPMRSTFTCDFLNSLFFMFRPKFIYMSCSIKGLTKTQRVTELILKPGEMYRREFWQPFLERDVSMQVFYSDRGGKWEPFEPEILSKLISKKGQSMDQNCLPIDMDRRIKLMIFKG